MRLQHPLTTRFIIFLLVSLLLGCSAARLGYRHGETISYWWLHSYVDFDNEQQPWIKTRIDKLFAWHHKTQLKDYVQLLGSAQKRITHTVTHDELLGDYEDLKKRTMLLVDRALPDLADLALSLNPQQIGSLEKKYASNNEKFRKDYLSGDRTQRQNFRYKKIMQQAEFWFGNFSREQEASIRKASDARPLNNELLMADRVQRQRELIALLKKIHADKPSREAVIALLREHIHTRYFDRSGAPADQKAFFDASHEGAINLALVIVNLTTPEQKAHAIKKAQQWIDDFKEMAESA